jgi:hypothetical protein
VLALTVGVILSAVFYLRRGSTIRGWVRRYIKQGFFRVFLGPKRVVVSEEGLRTTWDGGDLVLNWGNLRNIVDADADHLALQWDENSFSLIPNRAFADGEAKARFLSLLDHYRTGGELGTAAAVPAAVPSVAATPQVTPHAPGAPWWRSREGVDTGEEAPRRQANRNGGGAA